MTADTEYEIPAGAPSVEPGTYLATLTALKPFTLYETTQGWTREQPDSGTVVESYNKIEWHFHTDDDQLIEGTTSTSRSERSTLYAWATGLGLPASVVLDRSKPIPASQLIGRAAMVTVALDKNGYARVASVVPAPKARGAAPMTTMPSQAQPGEFSGAPLQTPTTPAAVPDDALGF